MQLRQMPSRFRTTVSLMVVAVLILAGCSDGSGGGLAVGDEAPGFALPTASGSIVSLDDYSGTPALLYFHMADG